MEGTTREKLTQLHKELHRIKGSLTHAVKALQTEIRAKEPDPYLLRRSLTGVFELFTSKVPAFSSSLPQIVEDIENLVQENKLHLPTSIENMAERNGWSLRGELPNYVFEGKVFVELDIKQHVTKINSRKLNTCFVSTLEKEVTEEVKAFEADTDPTAFLEDLFSAYRSALARSGGEVGNRASIYDVISELGWSRQDNRFLSNPIAKNLRDYSQNTFRADLYDMLDSQVVVTRSGYRLSIESGSFSKDAIFMFFPHQNRFGYCGRISFHLDTDA